MEQLVITVLGDDRTGLVEVLSATISDNGGNWERAEMVDLAGKFAGILLVTVPPSRMEALQAELERIEASGLLSITAARVRIEEKRHGSRFLMQVTGQDHPGIVHEISHALAEGDVNIEEFSSEIVPAAQGGHLFMASAVLDAPAEMTFDDLQNLVEAVATDLIVDLVPED